MHTGISIARLARPSHILLRALAVYTRPFHRLQPVSFMSTLQNPPPVRGSLIDAISKDHRDVSLNLTPPIFSPMDLPLTFITVWTVDICGLWRVPQEWQSRWHRRPGSLGTPDHLGSRSPLHQRGACRLSPLREAPWPERKGDRRRRFSRPSGQQCLISSLQIRSDQFDALYRKSRICCTSSKFSTPGLRSTRRSFKMSSIRWSPTSRVRSSMTFRFWRTPLDKRRLPKRRRASNERRRSFPLGICPHLIWCPDAVSSNVYLFQNRSHPSAPNKPPFETLAGLMSAPMDKLKDMFSKFPTTEEKQSIN